MRYEAELARRPYMKVDPDNRLAADSLEATGTTNCNAIATPTPPRSSFSSIGWVAPTPSYACQGGGAASAIPPRPTSSMPSVNWCSSPSPGRARNSWLWKRGWGFLRCPKGQSIHLLFFLVDSWVFDNWACRNDLRTHLMGCRIVSVDLDHVARLERGALVCREVCRLSVLRSDNQERVFFVKRS